MSEKRGRSHGQSSERALRMLASDPLDLQTTGTYPSSCCVGETDSRHRLASYNVFHALPARGDGGMRKYSRILFSFYGVSN